MKKIPRRQAINEELFVNEFVRANQPVIITDAMETWIAKAAWNPAYFEGKFGAEQVQVYNSLFTLLDVETLGSYLARNFARGPEFIAQEYVRGYVKFKDVDFVWADHIFRELSADWSHPYFFPRHGFVLPRCDAGAAISPVADPFPYKGLFISGQGARTSLHRDPYGTDAILCQFHGEKKLVVYGPGDADKLMRDGEFVDPANVDQSKFPAFASLTAAFEDTLLPGEVLFIPCGWFHDVQTLSDSISVTWNFVHSSNSRMYAREVSNAANRFDRDMLSYLA